MLLITSFAVLRNTAAILDFAVCVGGLYNDLEVAFQLRVLTCSLKFRLSWNATVEMKLVRAV